MHRTFVPIPSWLSSSDQTTETVSTMPLKSIWEFQFKSFKTLYHLGLTDKQVVHLTALLSLLVETDTFRVPITESKVKNMPRVRWHLKNSKFYQSCSSFEELIEEWVKEFLPRTDSRISQSFWAGSEDWYVYFFGSKNLDLFDRMVDLTRNRFAQHCLGVPITGIWNSQCILVCRTFQNSFPKVVLPWKRGTLDGFTYKLLARYWKRKQGIKI